MPTDKRLKSEVDTDQASLDYRRERYANLVNPCPRCSTQMQYIQTKEFEGWRCNKCAKDVALGNPAPAKPPLPDDQNPEVIRTKIRRFSDRRSGSC